MLKSLRQALQRNRSNPEGRPRDEWAERAKRMLKAELKLAGVGYDELARRLSEMGLHETVGSITVKVNRGRSLLGSCLP